MGEPFDVGFVPSAPPLPIVENTLRGAQADLAAVDAAARRATDEALVTADGHLRALDAQLLQRPVRQVKRAYDQLQSLDQQILAPSVSTIETARSQLAGLGGPVYCYLVACWFVFRIAIDYALAQTTPDRVYAVCYASSIDVGFWRGIQAPEFLDRSYYVFQQIDIGTWQQAVLHKAPIPAAEDRLLVAALGNHL